LFDANLKFSIINLSLINRTDTVFFDIHDWQASVCGAVGLLITFCGIVHVSSSESFLYEYHLNRQAAVVFDELL
jgi:hypothetical protein